MHKRLVILAASFFAIQAPMIPSMVVGTVRSAETGEPIPYTLVAAPDQGIEQFSNDNGAFTLRDVRPGKVKLLLRHLGYAALDTSLDLDASQTLNLDVRLKKLTINLDAMRTVGSVRVHLAEGCPPFSSADEQAAIVQLLEQVILNADQYRLLVKDHPFISRFTDKGQIRRRDSVEESSRAIEGATITPRFSTLSTAHPDYQAGKVIRHIGGSDQLIVPQIQDLADTNFIGKHCFSYAGETTMVDTKMVRLAFRPVAELTDPDIEGLITLRSDGYELREIDLRTTGELPKKFASKIAAVRINTQFRDLLPGIAILSRLESFLTPGEESRKKDSTIVTRGEVQSLVNIGWQRGPP